MMCAQTVIEIAEQECRYLMKFIACVFLGFIVDRKLTRVQEVRAGTEFHTRRKLRQPNKAGVNHTKGAQGS